jgi:hypothetical protein
MFTQCSAGRAIAFADQTGRFIVYLSFITHTPFQSLGSSVLRCSQRSM